MPQTDPIWLMRAQMTPAEQTLWFALRARRWIGVKFSRQVVIAPYVADFVARSHRLVIELDGHTHVDPEADAHRTEILQSRGCRVIRFTNRDVMMNLDGVLEAVGVALAACPSPNPLPKGERA